MVNLGGGFPTKYLKNVPAVEAYGESIFRALSKHFGNRIPETIIEPGRGMVGNAGIIESEVVLISKKSRDEDEARWVYLDIGKFGGLAETMDESIRYPIRTDRDEDKRVPCVLAGPTCDSADVLYEKEPYLAPVQPRDRRQGADRGRGRLHDHLRGGRLQRLPAAEELRHLTRLSPGGRGRVSGADRVSGDTQRLRRGRRCHPHPVAADAATRPPPSRGRGFHPTVPNGLRGRCEGCFFPDLTPGRARP